MGVEVHAGLRDGGQGERHPVVVVHERLSYPSGTLRVPKVSGQGVDGMSLDVSPLPFQICRDLFYVSEAGSYASNHGGGPWAAPVDELDDHALRRRHGVVTGLRGRNLL